MSKLLNFLTISCLLVFVSHAAFGQTTNATLSGVVEDQNGNVVPGVKITVSNPATGLRRSVVTDDSGAYVVPLLPPATYEILAEAANFKRIQIPDVVLNVNDQRSLRIELEAGNIAEEVTVKPNDGVTVKVSPEVSTVMDEKFVQNLPLNGRSFSTLVLLTPGVTIMPSPSGYGQFSVNGQRASTNYFTVDGVGANAGINAGINSDTQAALGGGFPATSALGGTTNLVSQDALQEFKVQTSTYTAENGRQPGAQVQVQTKSGTNEFHGTAFEFFRNEALDARGYFNKKPAPQTPLRQNIFGATLGGPIYLPNFGDGGPGWYNGKNRTFFFFSYEGHRIKRPVSQTFNVPSLRVRGFAAPAVKRIFDAFPIPNGPELTTNVACQQPPLPQPPDTTCAPNDRRYSGLSPYFQSVSNPATLDATSIRIDHAINSKHSVFGRFNESPSDSTVRTSSLDTLSQLQTRTVTIGAASSLGAGLTNDFRVNVTRNHSQSAGYLTEEGGSVPVDVAAVAPAFPGQVAVIFNPAGFSIASAAFGLNESAVNVQNQFNLVDNVTWIKSSHIFKFGADIRQLSPVFEPKSFVNISFSNEAVVRDSNISRLSVSAREAARPRYTNVSVFAQDTWKATRRLTLDLGLRYELNPAPTEADGKMPLALLGINGPEDVPQATLAPPGTPFYKTFYTAFAPRFGAAYQLRTKQGSETVLRGGFGVYYDLGSSGTGGGFPRSALRGIGIVPFPLTPADVALPPITGPSPNLNANAENLKLPYSFQWNVAAEQSFGKEHVLSMSYVGSAGRRLLATRILNNPSVPTGPRPNPNLGLISFTYNGPTSDYHSMQLQYRVRMKRGVQALVNYTWSHAIDEISVDAISFQLMRGNASFDLRHNLSAALHYDLPRIVGGGFMKYFLNGWGFDAIVFAQSGLPVDIVSTNIVIDAIQVSRRADLVLGQPLYIEDASLPGGRRFNPLAFSTPPAGQPGSFGRNVMRDLPFFQTDIALSRILSLTERVKLQLRGEAFNVFNNPSFASPNTFLGAPTTFGVYTRTRADSMGGLASIYQQGGPRSIQLSAKFIF